MGRYIANEQRSLINVMNKRILCLIVLLNLIQFNSYAKTNEPIIWSELATLNIHLLEKKAKEYLFTEMPELKGIEVKIVQVDAQYHKDGPSLDITFIHENSFKAMEQNKTLGDIETDYGIKYYMEFVRVEFSLSGEPENIRLKEVLLGKTEKQSKDSFIKHYNLY
jgi:hypothetical protein